MMADKRARVNRKPAIERSVTMTQYGLCFVRTEADYNLLTRAMLSAHDIDQIYKQEIPPSTTHPGCWLVLTRKKATNEMIATAIKNGGLMLVPEHHDRTKE